MKTSTTNLQKTNKTILRSKAVKKNSVPIASKTKQISKEIEVPEILFITSYPPRVCGIATYSQDLITALETKFDQSFQIRICPIETENETHTYSSNITHVLNIDSKASFEQLTVDINQNPKLEMVLIQHEFGLFRNKETELQDFLLTLNKPIIIVFHTVLPHPIETVKTHVQKMVFLASSIIVMTQTSASILNKEYQIPLEKINVIPHGTHLVAHTDKHILKQKHHIKSRKVLSTFGLLSSGKSIETTLKALPAIIAKNPDVLFLIIGKTHPSVVKSEGEQYRDMLYERVNELKLHNHVKFVNQFLPLPELLDYLQMTDVYLFTSKDPNQAVSGTFAYALSCGCPIVSTPIPHAKEILNQSTGISIDFENSEQLAQAVNNLLENDTFRTQCSLNGLHTMAKTAWENSAISHARLFGKTSKQKLVLDYKIPAINLKHIRKMTTDFGMIQFSKINHPDLQSGYTLDDNARALVALGQHFQWSNDASDLHLIQLYVHFIAYCLQPDDSFFNYVNENREFTLQNHETNLNDAHGRAIWALGYTLSLKNILPQTLVNEVEILFSRAINSVLKIHSTRSMAFIIKGLYFAGLENDKTQYENILIELSNRLVQMYRHERDENWQWFESYLTYGNSLIPEALLCAYQATGLLIYKEIAKESFDFLLSKTFHNNTLKIISNSGWMHNNQVTTYNEVGGEQPIDVAYTLMALARFKEVFPQQHYGAKMKIAFNWFLGKNHLHQIMYNPSTGGCYDGLEKDYVNLNQGAESTISYLLARMTIENAVNPKKTDCFPAFLELEQILFLNA